MDFLVNGIQAVANFLWGTPMTIALLGIGIYMTIKFKFKYQFSLKFMFQNSIGKLFKKGEKGEGTISSFAAGCTALASTVGVGNIAGVATAVTMGGPGAIVWMWVAGLVGMSTMAAEIILGQRYRVRYKSSNEFMCERAFVVRDAMGWKVGGFLVGLWCVISGPWSNLTQSEAFTNSIHEAFGIDKRFILAFLGITVFITVAGGLKRISAVAEKAVPFMAILYIVACVGILVIFHDRIPAAFGSIFSHAFTPIAGIGGFAGATVRDAVRYGLARGMYSNDAGTGLGIVLHAPARTDHPVRQSAWAWGEIFVDTIVICTMTALTLIITNSYIDYGDITSGQLSTISFRMAYGEWGAYLMAIILGFFVWTTIIALFYSCEKSLNFCLGKRRLTPVLKYAHICYYVLPLVFLSTLDVAAIWALQDLISAVFILLTVTLIIGNRKEIMRLFHDFFDNYLPALKRGENPEPVIYGEVVDDEASAKA